MLNAARALSVARMGLGLATILNAVEMYALLSKIAGGMIALPVVAWMPEPASTAVGVYLVLAVAAGLALAVGWHAAGAAALTTVLNVAVFLWDQQTYSSHRLLAALLVAYLIFARSDAAWSVSRRGGPVPWWPRLLMMTQLSVCYLFAAASKMTLLFLSGVPLSGWVWVPLPWWMFTLMAAGTVLVELFLAVGLWLRRTRKAAFVLGGALHLSIVAMMSGQNVPLLSFALTCVSLYPLFLVRPDALWVTARAPERPVELEPAAHTTSAGAHERRRAMHVIAAFLLVMASPALAGCGATEKDAPARPATPVTAPEEGDVRIRISIGDERFEATLDDSAASRELAAQLPVTLTMSDHGGVEKTGRLPSPLSLDGQPGGADPDVGDVGYYAPGNDLVLYYGDQSYFDGIVVLGQMDGDAADRIAEMDGRVTVTVERFG